ncbi:hypothetical protein COOONC_24653, partial [Cooperia oncophora]
MRVTQENRKKERRKKRHDSDSPVWKNTRRSSSCDVLQSKYSEIAPSSSVDDVTTPGRMKRNKKSTSVNRSWPNSPIKGRPFEDPNCNDIGFGLAQNGQRCCKRPDAAPSSCNTCSTDVSHACEIHLLQPHSSGVVSSDSISSPERVSRQSSRQTSPEISRNSSDIVGRKNTRADADQPNGSEEKEANSKNTGSLNISCTAPIRS